MNTWKQFEIDCTNFLTKQFGEYASFKLEGGSDSTVPDIQVKTKKNKQFYIEAKHSPAQCGQFVLLPNLKINKFEYSKLNSIELNAFSKIIIEHMNDNFEEFKVAGTAGKNIEFTNCESVFNNWIIKSYKDKGVKFFITNNYVILPVEKLAEYFNITAKYRIKRSGSSSVEHKNIDKVIEYLNSTFPNSEIKNTYDKVFIKTSNDAHNHRFIIDNNEFMLSRRENNFEVRKLSNTYNANVIFSLKLKTNKEGLSIANFILNLVN